MSEIMCNAFRMGCNAKDKYGRCTCLNTQFLDKDCPFFKTKAQYIEEQSDLRAKGHVVCRNSYEYERYLEDNYYMPRERSEDL